MSSSFRVRLLVVLIAAGVGMIGCGNGILSTEPFVDAERDAQGNVVLRDTPRMWQEWQHEVQRAVEKEAQGKPPGGGISTWNAQWLRVIDANSDRENAPRYIAYIIETRRRAGLPELEGYPASSNSEQSSR